MLRNLSGLIPISRGVSIEYRWRAGRAFYHVELRERRRFLFLRFWLRREAVALRRETAAAAAELWLRGNDFPSGVVLDELVDVVSFIIARQALARISPSRADSWRGEIHKTS